jgi:putative transposase
MGQEEAKGPMKREKKKQIFSDEVLDELISKGGSPSHLLSSGGLLHQLKGALMERILRAEMDDHLGYDKHEKYQSETGNNRNGTSQKTVTTESGAVRIEIPRDRDGTFEPLIVPKNVRRLEGFDEKVLSLYARGMSMRDIQSHLYELYGTDVSPELISRVTDSVLELFEEWQLRPLNSMYPIVYLDALFVHSRETGAVAKRAIYVALGVQPNGERDVLGLWMQSGEGAKFWMQVLTDLRNRGVQDMLFVCCDGLTGFPKAIEAVYPKAIVQTCIVHMIRGSLNYVGYSEKKAMVAALKTMYGAATVREAEVGLVAFEKKYSEKYPAVVAMWKTRWAEVIPFLSYPREVRRVLYTTNAIESVNFQLRKVLRSKGVFPNDNAALKLCFVALKRAKLRWKPSPAWSAAKAQFAIVFGDRFLIEV